MRKWKIIVCSLLISVISACEGESRWSKVGETHPEEWAKIEKSGTCEGQMQSPVNIVEEDAIYDNDLASFEIHYSPTRIHSLSNNGHTLQFNFEEGDYLELGGVRYDLVQIHFHQQSEHSINGKFFPLEIHLVHRDVNNNFAVIAIMVDEGETSEAIAYLETFLPVKEGETVDVNEVYDLRGKFLLPRDYYYYEGSLTTPPCTEGVKWFVFKNPLSINSQELGLFRELLPVANYRGIQDLNSRKVKTNH